MTDSSRIEPDAPDAAPSRAMVRSLLATIVVAALVAVLAGGYFWGNRSDGGSGASVATPTTGTVDAGFARDMAVHHRQAVTMAEYTMTRSTNSDVKLIAFDIDATQSVQLGEMQGWLESWEVSPTAGTAMSWMGHDAMSMSSTGLMPGMATPTQMTRLQAASGSTLDTLFLQLMIHHHQGGISMAKYAAAHAKEPYVQSLAQKMVNLQTSEITQMEQLLRQLGGTPLPAPVG